MKYLVTLFILLLLAACAAQDEPRKKVQDGLTKSHYPDGTPEIETLYDKGTRVSIKHFYPSGQLHTEIDSLGNYRQYFADGTLAMEFTEKDGKKIGDEKIYYSNGNPRSILKYKDDGVCYLREDFYENGAMKSSCKIVQKPKRHEICQTFYKSGQKRMVTTDDDRYTLYYENGTLEKESVYRGDVLVEEREYYATGNPKEITKYTGAPVKGCSRLCNLSEEVSFYTNGKIKDSCYVEKPLDWDGKSGRELARVCKKFYENGNVKENPVYLNAKLKEKKEYYSSGVLKEHKVFGGKDLKEMKEYYSSGTLREYTVYGDSGKQSLRVTRYKNGLLRDSCFHVDSRFEKSFRNDVCNNFSREGKPRNLWVAKEGTLLEKRFHDNEKLESLVIYGTEGKLAYTRYFEDGSVKDSCFVLYRNGESRDICKWYGNDRSLYLSQVLKGDTIYEKKFNAGMLMSECAIVWKGRSDETSRCKSYYKEGTLRDSSIKIQKPDSIFSQIYGCDREGKFNRYAESRYWKNGNLTGTDDKYCNVVNGELVDCREEHLQRGEK